MWTAISQPDCAKVAAEQVSIPWNQSQRSTHPQIRRLYSGLRTRRPQWWGSNWKPEAYKEGMSLVRYWSPRQWVSLLRQWRIFEMKGCSQIFYSRTSLRKSLSSIVWSRIKLRREEWAKIPINYWNFPDRREWLDWPSESWPRLLVEHLQYVVLHNRLVYNLSLLLKSQRRIMTVDLPTPPASTPANFSNWFEPIHRKTYKQIGFRHWSTMRIELPELSSRQFLM